MNPRLVCQLQPQKFLKVCCIQVRRGHFGTIEVVKKRLVPPMIGVIWPLKKDSMEPSDWPPRNVHRTETRSMSHCSILLLHNCLVAATSWPWVPLKFFHQQLVATTTVQGRPPESWGPHKKKGLFSTRNSLCTLSAQNRPSNYQCSAKWYNEQLHWDWISKNCKNRPIQSLKKRTRL